MDQRFVVSIAVFYVLGEKRAKLTETNLAPKAAGQSCLTSTHDPASEDAIRRRRNTLTLYYSACSESRTRRTRTIRSALSAEPKVGTDPLPLSRDLGNRQVTGSLLTDGLFKTQNAATETTGRSAKYSVLAFPAWKPVLEKRRSLFYLPHHDRRQFCGSMVRIATSVRLS